MRHLILVAISFFAAQYVQSQTAYEMEIASWKKDRIAYLQSENGWLNLAGLFWVKEGRQYFGGANTDDIRFPIPSFPSQVGYFEYEDDKVTLVLKKNIAINVNGKFIKESIVFHPDSLEQPILSFAQFRWTFIRRDNLIGIRMRNLEHPAIKTLHEIPTFSVDTSFKVKAKLIRPLVPANISVANVLGQNTQQLSPGKLIFSLFGMSYTVDALQEGNKLFIVFGDRTSGRSTYAAGRYLYAEMPGEDGFTILDFNKAFNPPCAFTAFATCLLPPSQNILPIAIDAGEKMVADH